MHALNFLYSFILNKLFALYINIVFKLLFWGLFFLGGVCLLGRSLSSKSIMDFFVVFFVVFFFFFCPLQSR